jgi:hypothetical protein
MKPSKPQDNLYRTIEIVNAIFMLVLGIYILFK